MTVSGNRLAGAQELAGKTTRDDVQPSKTSQDLMSKKAPTLKDLLFLGRTTTTLAVGDFSFDIVSLTGEDQKFLLQEMSKAPIEQRPYYVRLCGLALSISKVNGVPLQSLYEGSDNGLTDFDKKVHILSNMQLSLIEILSAECDKVSAKSSSSLKEIDEDIKK